MENKMQLFLDEIFTTIQGEGNFTGYATLFIRFQGCHVHCKFCDTKKSWTKLDGILTTVESTFEQVKMLLKGKDIKHILITGGEPLIQMEAFIELTRLIHEFDSSLTISVETSGAVDTNKLPEWIHVIGDVKLMSAGTKVRTTITNTRPTNSVVKFVIFNDEDWNEASSIMNKNDNYNFIISFGFDDDWKCVTPVSIREKVEEFCKMKPNVRVGLQIHKILNYR